MAKRTFETTYPAYGFAPMVTLALAVAKLMSARRALDTPTPEGVAVNSIG